MIRCFLVDSNFLLALEQYHKGKENKAPKSLRKH